MEHFSAMAQLEASFAARKICIYEHSYHYLAFGSWMLVIGNAHKRLQFVWEGRDGALTAYAATLQSQKDHPQWHALKSVTVQESETLARMIETTLEFFAKA